MILLLALRGEVAPGHDQRDQSEEEEGHAAASLIDDLVRLRCARRELIDVVNQLRHRVERDADRQGDGTLLGEDAADQRADGADQTLHHLEPEEPDEGEDDRHHNLHLQTTRREDVEVSGGVAVALLIGDGHRGEHDDRRHDARDEGCRRPQTTLGRGLVHHLVPLLRLAVAVVDVRLFAHILFLGKVVVHDARDRTARDREEVVECEAAEGSQHGPNANQHFVSPLGV